MEIDQIIYAGAVLVLVVIALTPTDADDKALGRLINLFAKFKPGGKE